MCKNGARSRMTKVSSRFILSVDECSPVGVRLACAIFHFLTAFRDSRSKVIRLCSNFDFGLQKSFSGSNFARSMCHAVAAAVEFPPTCGLPTSTSILPGWSAQSGQSRTGCTFHSLTCTITD